MKTSLLPELCVTCSGRRIMQALLPTQRRWRADSILSKRAICSPPYQAPATAAASSRFQNYATTSPIVFSAMLSSWLQNWERTEWLLRIVRAARCVKDLLHRNRLHTNVVFTRGLAVV